MKVEKKQNYHLKLILLNLQLKNLNKKASSKETTHLESEGKLIYQSKKNHKC